MCGIAGFWDTAATANAEALRATARTMASRMTHRGPDDAGEWADERHGLALAHRRLSILDLSPEGHQPMRSADGRWVVVYNGEIYNHDELRAGLAARGHRFRGHSDTEVLLAAVAEYGLEAAVARFNGMFAFALWDDAERRLHLVRDRLGEKPLYHAWCGGVFVFGSELGALRAHPAVPASVDPGALALYLRHGYIPAPRTILAGVSKLPPGQVLTVSADVAGRSAAPVPYWSALEALRRGSDQPFTGDGAEAETELDTLLRDAVRLRMHADVPLGAFLSGGVDSSTVVGLMQAQSPRPVKTFTIGFEEDAFDEAEDARRVATHLGTDHTETYLTARDALEAIPEMPRIYDEPFADSSQIPTFLVSRVARRHVTVSLSGDGGDELFGGYSRYFLAATLWRNLQRVPAPVRRAAASAIEAAPGLAGLAFSAARRVAARGVSLKAPPRDQALRLARLLGRQAPADLYLELVSLFPEPARFLHSGEEPPSSLKVAQSQDVRRPLIEQLMYWDSVSYLPDDILVKLDRATMAVSLEGRIPFLDHRILELAWRLPIGLKVGAAPGKNVLKQVLYRYVPRALVDRPKRGFAIPIDAWLRGPLRSWVLDLLSEERLRRQALLRPAAVTALVADHLEGRRACGAQVWALVMLQAWLDEAGLR